MGKGKPALSGSETLKCGAELHRVPFTYLLQKGALLSQCEGHHPGTGYLYSLLAKHSYGGCSYSCKSGVCANTTNSAKVKHRHAFRHSLPVQQEHHTEFAGSHLYHPDSHCYHQHKPHTFKSIICSLDKPTGCLAA